MKRIEEKIKAGQTEEITEPQTEERLAKGAEVVDLMALLRKSVEGGGRKGAAKAHKEEKEEKNERAHKPRRAAHKRRAA